MHDFLKAPARLTEGDGAVLKRPGDVNSDCPPNPPTVGHYLSDAAAHWPEKVALHYGDATFSYRQLWLLSQKAAVAFRRAGVGPGTRVGVLLPNSPHHLFMTYGVLIAGGCVVNLSVEMSAKGLGLQVANTGVDLLVTAGSGQASDKVRDLLKEGTALASLVLCDVDNRGAAMDAGWNYEGVRVYDAEKFLAGGEDEATDWPRPQLDDMALIQFTGGTTGVPKGAVLHHSQLSAAVELTRQWMGPVLLDDDRRLSLSLPLSHIFGYYTAALCFATGTPIRLHRRFDPFEVASAIGSDRATIIFGVPTMYAAMLATGVLTRERASSLKLCAVGGAPLTEALRRQFQAETGLSLREGYGMSETCSNAAMQPVSFEPTCTALVPMPLTTIEIVDLQTGLDVLPPDELGEVCITGPQVMAGYWDNPEETAWAFRGGRFHTGDIGRLDEQGYLVLIDRKKDMILTGGFNVFPSTVEAALCEHPAVQDAAVLGMDDPLMGQVVKAFLSPRPGADRCTYDELLDFLTPRLASFEMPVRIEWRDELPKTPVGKIARNLLRPDSPGPVRSS